MGLRTYCRCKMVRNWRPSVLLIVGFTIGSILTSEGQRRIPAVNDNAIKQWLALFCEANKSVKDFHQVLGGRLEPMPPNQAVLNFDTGLIKEADFVLSRDHDLTAPPMMLDLILAPKADLRLKELEALWGRSDFVDEDVKRPRPADLVRFKKITCNHRGDTEILMQARVEKPATRNSYVRSISFAALN